MSQQITLYMLGKADVEDDSEEIERTYPDLSNELKNWRYKPKGKPLTVKIS